MRNFSNHSQPKPPPCCCHCCSYYVVASCLQALPLCTAATGALCLHTSWPSCWVALQLPWSPGRCTGLDCSLAGAQGSSGSSRGMLQQATRCSAAGRPCGCPQQPRCARAGHTPVCAAPCWVQSFSTLPSAHKQKHPRSLSSFASSFCCLRRWWDMANDAARSGYERIQGAVHGAQQA